MTYSSLNRYSGPNFNRNTVNNSPPYPSTEGVVWVRPRDLKKFRYTDITDRVLFSGVVKDCLEVTAQAVTMYDNDLDPDTCYIKFKYYESNITDIVLPKLCSNKTPDLEVETIVVNDTRYDVYGVVEGDDQYTWTIVGNLEDQYVGQEVTLSTCPLDGGDKGRPIPDTYKGFNENTWRVYEWIPLDAVREGILGPEGLQGIAGLKGPKGELGEQGATGATGVTGPTGATGVTGATGATGPDGFIGQYGVAKATEIPYPDNPKTFYEDRGDIYITKHSNDKKNNQIIIATGI